VTGTSPVRHAVDEVLSLLIHADHAPVGKPPDMKIPYQAIKKLEGRRDRPYGFAACGA
jgi:hypothetical protein